MMTDPIADMLTRIRNASMIGKKEVVFPYSKIKLAIANILVQNGYLKKVEEIKDKHTSILISLKYDNGQPVIHHIKRLSKPGRRNYVKSDEIKEVLNGFGLSILSTSHGLMTHKQAKKAKVGGELLCEIY